MNAQNLIGELEHELVSTGKLLELVPANQLDWRPNKKAMTLGQLANHVAVIPERYFGFADEGNTELDTLTTHAHPKDKKEILDNFKSSRTKAMEVLGKVNGASENRTWNLTKKGVVVFSLPFPLYTRLLVFNHLIHHRGQLSTYLRSLDIRIPSIYGPSGDENPFA
jgi:uncharacterized damage-inducible protein DinB